MRRILITGANGYLASLAQLYNAGRYEFLRVSHSDVDFRDPSGVEDFVRAADFDVCLHMAADALVSIGVLVSGVVISWTGWTLIDPIVGLAVAGVIVASVWSLTRDSLRLSLDGVPAGIDVAELERRMRAVPGVQAVHHIHVWALSTTENALTAHVVLSDFSELERIKRDLKALAAHSGISHATLEFETASERCADLCD